MTLAEHHRPSLAASATFALGALGATAVGWGLTPVVDVAQDVRPVVAAAAPWPEATLPSPVTERRRDAVTDLGS